MSHAVSRRFRISSLVLAARLVLLVFGCAALVLWGGSAYADEGGIAGDAAGSLSDASDSASDASDSASDASDSASDSSDSESASDARDEGNDEARSADGDSHEGSAESSDGNAGSSDGGTQSDASEASAAAEEADHDSSSEPTSSDDGGDSEVNVKPVEGDRESIEVSDDGVVATARSDESEDNSRVELQASTTVEANESTVSVEVSEDAPEGEGKATPGDAGKSLDTTKDVTANAGRTDPDESAARAATVVGSVNPSDAAIGAEAESGVQAKASVYDAAANLELDTTSAVAANANNLAEIDQRTVTQVQAVINPSDTTIGAGAESVLTSVQDAAANLELDVTTRGASPGGAVQRVLDAVAPVPDAVHESDTLQTIGTGAVSVAAKSVRWVSQSINSRLTPAVAEVVDVTTPTANAPTVAADGVTPRVGNLAGSIAGAIGGHFANQTGVAGAVVAPSSSGPTAPGPPARATYNGSRRGGVASSGGASATAVAPSAETGAAGAGPSDHTSAPSGAARLPGLRLRAPPHLAGVYPAQAAASPPSGYAPGGADYPAGDSPVPGVPPAPVGGGLASSAGTLLSGGGGGFDTVPALAVDIAASLALALLGLLFASRTIPRSHLHAPLVSPG